MAIEDNLANPRWGPIPIKKHDCNMEGMGVRYIDNSISIDETHEVNQWSIQDPSP